MKQITGLSADQVVTCPQNETVSVCPQAKNTLKSFVVIAHNQQAHANNQFVRILLPSNKYTAMVWSKDQLKFIDTQNFDILEQPHYKQGANKNGESESDFMMFVNLSLLPNEVGFVKVVQTTKEHEVSGEIKKGSSTLEISGFTDLNEALFKYTKADLT